MILKQINKKIGVAIFSVLLTVLSSYLVVNISIHPLNSLICLICTIIIFYLIKVENISIIINPFVSFIVFYIILNLIGLLFINEYAYVVEIKNNIILLFVVSIFMLFLGGMFYKKFICTKSKEYIKRIVVKFNYIENLNVKLLLLIFMVGIILSIYYFKSVGGIPMLMENADDARVTLKQGKGYIFIIIYSIFLNTGLLIGSYLIYKKKYLSLSILTIVIVGIILGIGYRGQALKVIVSIYFLWSFIKHGRIKILKSITIATLLLFFLGILGYYRTSGQLIYNNLNGVWMINRWRFFVNLYNVQIVSNFIGDTKLLGKSVILDLSTLLPGYQPSFNIWLKEYLGLDFSGGGLTSTVIGELFFNFGYIISFIVMFLLGMLLYKINQRYINKEVNFYDICLLIIICITTTSLISSSIFSALLYDIVPNIILFKFIIKFATFKTGVDL